MKGSLDVRARVGAALTRMRMQMRMRMLMLMLTLLAVPAGCGGEAAEGRPWVHHVQITGVKHVDAGDLKSHLMVEETHFYTNKKYLDPFTVDFDRTRIEAYYRDHGYHRARVTGTRITAHKGSVDNPTSVDVTMDVAEGLPTHIDSVKILGLDAIGKPGDALAAAVYSALKKDAVFDHGVFELAKAKLELGVQLLGYASAKVVGVAEVNRDTRLATLAITVTPGPLSSFGQVQVRGTQRVSAELIERHTGIVTGARFSPEDVEDARGQVYNLGVFSSVRVTHAPQPGNPGIVDVLVTVQETTFNELRLGAGFGLESQRTDVHASLTYARHNWLGGVRTLRLRLEPAYVAIPAFWNVERQGPAVIAEATLTQPDFLWPLTQLKLTLGYDLGIEYPYQYHGPRAQLGLARGVWRDRVRVGLSYNFQLLQFFNTDPSLLSDPAQTGQLFGYVNPYRLGWLQQDFALDLRDRPLDAHRGAYLGVSVEEGGAYAGGAFLYEKVTPEVRAYVPLGSRVTIAVRGLFGQIFSQGDLGSPITRRFYLGGPGSHRGFNYNRLSRQVPSSLRGVQPIPIGGDQMLLLSGELRANLVSLGGNWFAVAAFLDAGDVSAPSCATAECRSLYTNTNVQVGDLHYAVGGGIRFKTLIGTLRFDVGVRLNRLSATEADGTPNPDPGQRVAFHISVGEAF